MMRAETGVRLPVSALTTSTQLEAEHVMDAPDLNTDTLICKDVPLAPGYRATSMGTVESSFDNSGKQTGRWHTLTGYDPKRTGTQVILISMGGMKRKVSIRSVILSAFHGGCPDGFECWIKNQDPVDTRPSNLLWAPIECTRLWYRLKLMENGCWEWQGAKYRNGYGNLKLKGKHIGAHQLAYELAVGPRPGGMWVLHRCDNPPCCNPEHLFLGTVQVNVDDMMAKGRHRTVVLPPERRSRGVHRPGAKLNDDIVRRIRDIYASGGVSQRDLAVEFRVSCMLVSQIVNLKIWKHVV
jgi:hypothetical protein